MFRLTTNIYQISIPLLPSQPLSTPFHSLQRRERRRDEDTQIAFALTAAAASTSSIFVLGCVSRRRLADRQLKSAYSFAVREARTALLPNCYNRGFAYGLAWRMIVIPSLSRYVLQATNLDRVEDDRSLARSLSARCRGERVEFLAQKAWLAWRTRLA